MKISRIKLRRLIESQILKEMFSMDMYDGGMSTGQSSVGMSGIFGQDDYELDSLFDEVQNLFDEYVTGNPVITESFGGNEDIKAEAKAMLNDPKIQNAAREIEQKNAKGRTAVDIMMTALGISGAGGIGGGLVGSMLWVLTQIGMSGEDANYDLMVAKHGGEAAYGRIVDATATVAFSFGFKIAFACIVVYLLYLEYQRYQRSRS